MLSLLCPCRAADFEGHFADGALWRLEVPDNWNGTLLLYSHGYSPDVHRPDVAPRGLENWLSAHGYALAASSYSRGGWAVAQAIPDQRLVIAEATARIGRAQHLLAWGDSMGGLITTALVETPGTGIDGGISACGSISGTLAMMNTALDGAFAFVTLQAPTAGIQLVAIKDDLSNAKRVQAAVRHALLSATGRARLALAGVIGGLPVWTDPETARPTDTADEVRQMAAAVPAGLFPPTVDQEQRAGGILSWNTGVDYRALLKRTGRESWVEHIYRSAGLSLDHDLKKLDAAPRITAQSSATDYMRRYYAPTARPLVPFLSFHTIGDGLTSEVLQAGYSRATFAGPKSANYRAASVLAAGHCRFSAAEYVAALGTLEARLRNGTWAAGAGAMNQLAKSADLGPARFIQHTAAPLLRACWAGAKRCAGAP